VRAERPTEPLELPDLVRRSARLERVSTGVAAVLLLIAPVAVGAAAIADDAPVVGATVLGLVAVTLAGLIGTSWRRYGRRGDRWVEQLRTAAAQAGAPRQVEVWFVVPSLEEGGRSQRTALVGEPGGRPVRAAKLLVELGRGLEPGPAWAWGGERGEPLLLEKDARSLWPARPTKGRVEVALVRFAAAIPFSTLTLLRPGARSRSR
jgi:hypothetical protein